MLDDSQGHDKGLWINRMLKSSKLLSMHRVL